MLECFKSKLAVCGRTIGVPSKHMHQTDLHIPCAHGTTALEIVDIPETYITQALAARAHPQLLTSWLQQMFRNTLEWYNIAVKLKHHGL